MSDKYAELVQDRDAFARMSARALAKGNNGKALRWAARFASAEADIQRYLEEVTR